MRYPFAGKGPQMQDDSLTKEIDGDVEPPIQRPSVSEGIAKIYFLYLMQIN